MKKRHVTNTAGMIVLAGVLTLLSVSTALTLVTAKNGASEQRLIRNEMNSKQAFEAAEAGLQYGKIHIKDWKPTNTMPTYHHSLANNTQFDVSFSQPNHDDPLTLKVVSRGESTDGTAKKTIEQLVKFSPLIFKNKLPNSTVIAKEEVTIRNTRIRTSRNRNRGNIRCGRYARINENARTTRNETTESSSTRLGDDILQNDASLANLSKEQFFHYIFGQSSKKIKKKSDIMISASSNNSNKIDIDDTIIWVDSNAAIRSNGRLGTVDKPVLLIINGTLTVYNNVTIYGMVYASNSIRRLGRNTTIYGSLVSAGSISLDDSANINYDESVLNKLRYSVLNFSPIPGSWIDR